MFGASEKDPETYSESGEDEKKDKTGNSATADIIKDVPGETVKTGSDEDDKDSPEYG